MKAAVLVIDMLNDFVTGKLGNERVRSVIEPIRHLLERARASGVPVAYIGDAHLPSDPEMAVWGPHAMKGTKEAETIPELAPQLGDTVLGKRTYSAFYETGLDLLLRSLGVDTVVITGLHTNICCRHTAADAFTHGYKIIVPEDCVNAFTEEEHREGIAYLRRVYGARITTSEELAREWEREPQTAATKA